MDDYLIYSKIMRLVNEYFELKEGQRYEDFVGELIAILEL